MERMLMLCVLAAVMAASVATDAGAQDARWPYQVTMERPPRRGKPSGGRRERPNNSRLVGHATLANLFF